MKLENQIIIKLVIFETTVYSNFLEFLILIKRERKIMKLNESKKLLN